MNTIKLGRSEFKDKVLACWVGKNIGGTLGGPWECPRHTHALTYYQPLPDKAAPNDDLDLQLVWLKMLEDQGLDPSVRTFAEYWSRYTKSYPWNEYGFFMRNFNRGLRPPVAGCFENYFVDEMGSPIRSEIWACLHPGDPQAAARMAWKDSAVDHAGGEGTYGEMFWAAVEAAAFVEKDPTTLIQLGLAMIPISSHLARAIRDAVWCFHNRLSWGQARERIHTQFGHIQPCNAIPNHGFTIIGWLYGQDFGDRLCKAVNCGYDTDCTGSTLGAVLGILDGTAGIPDLWRKPIGDHIVLHKFTGPCNPPKTVQELTDRTVALAEKATVAKSNIRFADKTELPPDLRTRLFTADLAQEALKQDPQAGVELADGEEIWFHYGGEPVLWPGIGRKVVVTTSKSSEPEVALQPPAGWTCERQGRNAFRLLCNGPVADRNEIAVSIGSKRAVFMMLGPGEAQGVRAGANVETCPKCGARKESCICAK
ncbi:MAG: ADP-ribosylglycohydrolase family protein [Kiritimatiellaeota bacterium]|nr:ADP-ribosylglycohydrolase family protein [Kiritimatiellota bacterium]